jgi:hypothetical protein
MIFTGNKINLPGSDTQVLNHFCIALAFFHSNFYSFFLESRNRVLDKDFVTQL